MTRTKIITDTYQTPTFSCSSIKYLVSSDTLLYSERRNWIKKKLMRWEQNQTLKSIRSIQENTKKHSKLPTLLWRMWRSKPHQRTKRGPFPTHTHLWGLETTVARKSQHSSSTYVEVLCSKTLLGLHLGSKTEGRGGGGIVQVQMHGLKRSLSRINVWSVNNPFIECDLLVDSYFTSPNPWQLVNTNSQQTTFRSRWKNVIQSKEYDRQAT